jgi:hypothetical protein
VFARVVGIHERSESHSGSNPCPAAFFATSAISVSAGTLVSLGVGVLVACFLALVYAGYRARQPSRR